MNINPYELYKVTEIDTAVVILRAADSMLNRPGAVDFKFYAPAAQIGEFLARYLHARANFKTIEEARAEALKGAKVFKQPNSLDG